MVKCPYRVRKGKQTKTFSLQLQEILDCLMKKKRKGKKGAKSSDKHFIVYRLEIQVMKAHTMCDDTTQHRRLQDLHIFIRHV